MTKMAIPTAPEELEEFLSDGKNVAALTAAGELPGALKQYARNFANKNTDLLAELRAQQETVLTDFLKENGAQLKNQAKVSLNPVPDGPVRGTVNNPRAIGAPLNGLFETPADFFQAVWTAGRSGGRQVEEKLTKVSNYMQERVPHQGGFLVPEEFRSEILRVALTSSVVRPRARVIPMSTLSLSFPTLDSTSNVSSVFGGVVAYWTEEGADLTASEPTFGRVRLEAKKLTAYSEASNELVSDWGALGAFLDDIFPQAVAWYEDLAYLTGSGVGQPLGALNAANPALITVAKETGQTAATIVWENVIRMYARMLPTSLNTAVWIASPDTFAELATMALSVGTGGSAVWLTDATGAPTLTLLGRPVIMSEKAPAVLGTQGDLSFVDFSMYLIGDRQSMSAEYSEHFKFGSDKTAFRVIQRVDGMPWLNSAITPQNNGATLSPFVQLATRA